VQAFHNANREEEEPIWEYKTGTIDPSILHALFKHWESGEVQTLSLVPLVLGRISSLLVPPRATMEEGNVPNLTPCERTQGGVKFGYNVVNSSIKGLDHWLMCQRVRDACEDVTKETLRDNTSLRVSITKYCIDVM
jgi:hypothetical protein